MKEEILENLRTNWLGKNIIYYKSIDSTQKEIYRMLEKNEKIENGTVILAEKQINGIGTHDRKWYSAKGENISFSFILYPNCTINKLEGFTIKIAEILVNEIKKVCNASLQIKEPNDLVYEGKKVGGILTKSVTNKNKVKQIVIGIGINVNSISFPEELQNTAISLKQITKTDVKKEIIIANFLNSFEKFLEKYIYDQSV